MQGLQKSCFSWVNGIVESSEVYFISINRGVSNRPYEAFEVDLKNSTILKISLSDFKFVKVGPFMSGLNSY